MLREFHLYVESGKKEFRNDVRRWRCVVMLFEFRKVLRVSWLRVGSVMWVRYSGVAMRSSLIL